MKLNFKKLDKNAVTPVYANKTDACFDLTATSVEFKEKYVQYGTGIALEIPEGHVGLLFPRSSVTKMDLMLKNSVGIIDSGYRGEIMLRYQLTKELENDTLLVYDVGDRIGQIMIIPIHKIELVEVNQLKESDRGEGGFGSTGK